MPQWRYRPGMTNERSPEAPRAGSQVNAMLLRMLVFGVGGLLVWLLVGLVVDAAIFDNPVWGLVAGLFVAAISRVSRHRT